MAPIGRACRPRGVAALTWSGARGAAVAASVRRGKAQARGLGWLRWLGRLVGAGPPMNNPSFLFLNLFLKCLNTDFETSAKLFRAWSKKRKCSP